MFKDKIILSLFVGSILLIILSSIVISLGLPVGTGALIIRFDNYHNQVDLVGGLSVLGLILGLMIAILVINLFLSHQVYERDKTISYIIALGNLVVSIFFFFASIAITLIN
ncbi:MAG: hypothetical protein COT88_01145 [Candidatus Colwellbacteria bacterium CG10_big_fil_rev_8_21_14_0_10_41_28]|uniref:Uncharacterized protein n=1 Tax=Candidatus Colwellbacteria bacterium CG10_big_fil_rev_8_21_14_0_10_41_28 TaxID=1974539 RepID=A0A2H0VHD3_9BACT|nr:MAG: hypothetical protein COT88_01145 [Candidatus Colwellbacteria bacterium CG10_big_fil_rev_8_21_14_0_10_41_28]